MTKLKWTKGLSVFLFMQGTRHIALHRCSYRGQRSIRELRTAGRWLVLRRKSTSKVSEVNMAASHTHTMMFRTSTHTLWQRAPVQVSAEQSRLRPSSCHMDQYWSQSWDGRMKWEQTEWREGGAADRNERRNEVRETLSLKIGFQASKGGLPV